MSDRARGKPKGLPKSGGRVKGSINKTTAAKIAEVAASGLTPLDFMLDILRDKTREEAMRFEAAKQAAPYCHAKLAAVDGSLEQSLTIGLLHYPGLDDDPA